MKSRHSIFFMPPPTVRILTVLALLVLAVSVMSGGCGSSSSSFPYQTVNTTMNGAWSYESGTVTATVNGTRQELTVQNFTILFESCDIEQDTGSAKFAAIGVLQGEHALLPMLFDRTAITTTRTDSDTWTANTEHGTFTVELLSDDTSARLTGSMTLLGSDMAKADVDVVLNKLASTAPTIDINTALNGEWQTKLIFTDSDMPIAGVGGGYLFHDGNIWPITSTFISMTFSDTSTQAGTTTLVGLSVQATDSSNDTKYEAAHSMIDHWSFNLTHMFGNVYILSNATPVFTPILMAVILEDENKMSLISSVHFTYDGAVEENRGMFSLDKTTAIDTFDLRNYVGSSWNAPSSVLNMYLESEEGIMLESRLASFDVSFPSADIADKKVTLSIKGAVEDTTGIVPIDKLSTTLTVENAGYHTWFGKTATGDLFTVTMISDRLAVLTGDIGYTSEDWYTADFFAFMWRDNAE